MDELDRDLMVAVATYLRHAGAVAEQETRDIRTPLGERVSAHLGVDVTTVPVVSEPIPDHRLVDADLVLERWQEAGGSLIGIRGGDYRMHAETAELLANPHTRFAPGPADYLERPTGPDTTRRVVGLGVRLLVFDGVPVAVVQRAAYERVGRETASVDVLGRDPEVVSGFLRRLREEMVAVSVLRGQVITLAHAENGVGSRAGFLPRPRVHSADVVLPDGVLAEIIAHALGIGEHRALLLGLGQHLKRGILLYGPPGTGKTLTVRHLIADAVGTTVVVLRGEGLGHVQQAAAIARTFQPSIVVLEDIDLVAMERHQYPQPLLFEVLDALDGLDGDADVAFVMTTNRVDVLEPALAERPGRVDLAMELPLPALPERVRLLALYARNLAFSPEALQRAAERTAGTTGSFAKELVRSSVLLAAGRAEEPADEHLAAALDELLGSGRRLTRRMLGDEGAAAEDRADGSA
ncbi:MAG: ATP-binding protein [Propionicimonas sp.]|nr:ATP-binding protein [Propionicimonas sp.]